MLRRAMARKVGRRFTKQRSVFEEGAKKNGIDGELAMKTLTAEKFAGYGFNKSHPPLMRWFHQTLRLSAHYPAERLAAAVMTADGGTTPKRPLWPRWTSGDDRKFCRRILTRIIPYFHVNDEGDRLRYRRDQRRRRRPIGDHRRA